MAVKSGARLVHIEAGLRSGDRKMPEEISEYAFAARYIGDELFQLDIAPTLVKEGLVKSIGELKRLLAQKAIEIDDNKICSTVVNAHQGSIIKI